MHEFLREKRKAELRLDEHQRLPFADMVHSIILGGEQRLRPVLLTAITAIIGLVPLAVGFNFNYNSFFHHWDPEIHIGGDNVVFWGPLAWTIIFGLSFATFLTLIIVPVMYLLFDKFRYWVSDKFFSSNSKVEMKG
jgi:multidrug efflux pump subunit AcrB